MKFDNNTISELLSQIDDIDLLDENIIYALREQCYMNRNELTGFHWFGDYDSSEQLEFYIKNYFAVLMVEKLQKYNEIFTANGLFYGKPIENERNDVKFSNNSMSEISPIDAIGGDITTPSSKNNNNGTTMALKVREGSAEYVNSLFKIVYGKSLHDIIHSTVKYLIHEYMIVE